MATYYVGLSGSNTAPYDTPAKAAPLFATVTQYIATNGGSGSDIIEVAAGVYTAGISLNHAALNGVTIRGAGEDTILAPASGNVVYCGANLAGGAKISRLTLRPSETGAGAYLVSTGDPLLFEEVLFDPAPGHNAHVFRSSAMARLLRCAFRGRGVVNSSAYGLYTQGAGGVILDFCTFTPAGDSAVGKGIVLVGTGVSKVRNCTILGAENNGISLSNGSVEVSNCIIHAGQASHLAAPVRVNSGTATVRNSILISSQHNTTLTHIIGAATEENNIKMAVNPQFAGRRGGFFVPTIDDAGGLMAGYCAALSTLLAERDCYGTWVTNTFNIPAANYSDARAILTAGRLEVGLHGRTHHDLTLTHALRFSQTGGTSPTVAFDGRYITCACTEPEFSQVIDTQAETANTTAKIIANYSGQKGWTISKSTTDGQATGGNADFTSPRSYAAMAATAAPCDIDFDRTGISQGVFKDIIADGVADLEQRIIGPGITDPQTGQPYRCRTFGATYNAGDLTVAQAVRDAGLDVYRYTKAATAEESISPLVRLDMFGLAAGGYAGLTANGTSEAAIKAGTRAICCAISFCGLAASMLAHNAQEFSIEQWGWVLDVVKNEFPEILVCSFQQLRDHVAGNSAWTHAGNSVYTRSFPAENLTPASIVAIGGGVVPFAAGDGDQLDAAGVKVWDSATASPVGPWLNGPTIGAVGVLAKYRTGGWASFDGSMPSMTAPAGSQWTVQQAQAWDGHPSAEQIRSKE